jgi:hypothetical protein
MSRSIIERVTLLMQPMTAQALASAVALPAAQAFTAATTFPLPSSVNELALWFQYSSAAAAGQLAIRPIFDFTDQLTAQYNSTVIDDNTVTAAQPFGQRKFYNNELRGPIPGIGQSVGFVLRIPVPRGATEYAIQVADLGAAPGSYSLSVTGGSNGDGND